MQREVLAWNGENMTQDRETTSNIISFGAGVNSIAMTILLFNRGEKYPIVFADTIAEHPETYCYMDYFEKKFLGKFGHKIIRLHPINTPTFYYPYARKPLEAYLLEKKRVPASIKGTRACTKGWKIEPIAKFKNNAKKIIAFALEEKKRIGQYTDDIYPLIDAGITRDGCRDIIKKAGLSIPPRSSCFFCSYQRISQWENLYRRHPDLFLRAMKLEENSQNRTIRPDRIKLSQLKDRFEAKGGNLFPDYDYEELTPCMCQL